MVGITEVNEAGLKGIIYPVSAVPIVPNIRIYLPIFLLDYLNDYMDVTQWMVRSECLFISW
jgi:hypothetical protein